jgi:hypothetical protein
MNPKDVGAGLRPRPGTGRLIVTDSCEVSANHRRLTEGDLAPLNCFIGVCRRHGVRGLAGGYNICSLVCLRDSYPNGHTMTG